MGHCQLTEHAEQPLLTIETQTSPFLFLIQFASHNVFLVTKDARKQSRQFHRRLFLWFRLRFSSPHFVQLFLSRIWALGISAQFAISGA